MLNGAGVLTYSAEMHRFCLLPLLTFHLVVASLGCSGSTDQPADGGGVLPDGTVELDATVPPDAEVPQPVAVVATRRGAPVPGLQVVFHGTSGEVLSTATTGADGRATSTGVVPSMASAVFEGISSSYSEIVTWTEVEPGDELALEVPASGPDPTVGTLEVTYPSEYSDEDGPASHHGFRTPCGTIASSFFSNPASLMIRESCTVTTGTVVALASRTGVRLAQSTAHDVAFPTDGETSSLELGTWAGLTPFEITATNLPAGDISPYAEGYELVGNTFLKHGTGLNDEGEGELRFVPGGEPTVGLSLSVVVWHDGSVSEFILRRSASVTASSTTFDLAEALPEITSATVTTTDPKRPQVAWTVAAPLTATAGGLARVRWRHDPDNAYVTWTFVVPPTALTVTAPSMPEELESFLPINALGDPLDVDEPSPVVTFVEAEELPSAADFRRSAGTLLPNSMYTSWVLDGFSALRTTTHSVGFD
jgi:hypothetical protein